MRNLNDIARKLALPVILLGALAGGPLACSNDGGSKPQQSAPQSESLEYKLAVINANGYVKKDHVSVRRFRYLLSTLDKRTIQSEQQLADMSVAAVTALREKYGKDISLLSFMEGMKQRLPPSKSNYVVEATLYMQKLKE